MKIKLVTGYNDRYASIGRLSASVMAGYCSRMGYQFVRYEHFPDPNRSPQWNKTRICQQELRDCDWLVWMDADAIPVTDFELGPLLKAHADDGKELVISSDDNGLCYGVYCIRNSVWSHSFLETLWFVGQMDYEHAKQYHPSPQHDQVSVVALVKNFPEIGRRVAVIPPDWVCNPRSQFNPRAFACHYWASDNPMPGISRLIESYIAVGWSSGSHRQYDIVTCANAAYDEIIKASMARNTGLGYKVRVYDIGSLGIGKPFNTNFMPVAIAERLRGRLPIKPLIILQGLKDAGVPVCWMDADAFAIRRFDDVGMDFDVAVTMRRPEERGATRWPTFYGFANAGVIFFNHTPAAFQFIDMWIREVEMTSSLSDQEALNRLVLQATDFTEYNKVFRLGAIRIKILKTDEYNFYYWPQDPLPETCIVHAKTDRRSAFDDWSTRDFKA